MTILLSTLEAAGKIDNYWDRSNVLSKIVIALTQAGNFGFAFEIAGKVRFLPDKITMLSMIIIALVQAGKPDEAIHPLQTALEVIKKINKPIDRSMALLNIASALSLMGRTDEAIQALNQTLELVEKINYYNSRSEVLSKIATVLGSMGRSDEALHVLNQVLEAAGKIDPPSYRSEALSSLAAAFAQAGSPEEALQALNQALEAAGKIDPPIYRSEALSKIAIAFSQMGRTEEALQAINQAFEAAGKIDLPNLKPSALANIAIALSQMGKTDEAYKLLNQALEVSGKIDCPIDKSRALSKIALAFIQMGITDEALQALDQALEAAGKIDCPGFRSEPLLNIIDALTQLGGFDQALEVTGKIIDPRYGSEARSKLAAALAQADRPEEALQVLAQALEAAGKIDLPSLRSGALSKIVAVLLSIDPQSAVESRINLLKWIKQTKDAVFKKQELERQARARTEKAEAERIKKGWEEEAIASLSSNDSRTRKKGLKAYFSLGMHDGRARLSLARAIENGEIELAGSVKELAILDKELADKTVFGFLKKRPDYVQGNLAPLQTMAEQNELTATAALIEGVRRTQEKEEEFRASLIAKIEEIAGAIKEKIASALGLEANQAATTSAGNGGSYGSISMGMSLSMKMKQQLIMDQQLVSGNFLEIEEGETIEEIKERIRTLNFLVHHEIGHLIQKQKKIKHPAINPFPLLDQKEVKLNANEILIDKLAFETARKIYVHGDGDVLFDEATRESISIKAYLTLSEVILRNLEAGKHDLSAECVARIIAVLCEISRSEEITGQTRSELFNLANVFRSRLKTGRDEARIAEMDKLILEYRLIFRSAPMEF